MVLMLHLCLSRQQGGSFCQLLFFFFSGIPNRKRKRECPGSSLSFIKDEVWWVFISCVEEVALPLWCLIGWDHNLQILLVIVLVSFSISL